MHYSRHRITALASYVTTLTYTSINDQWDHPIRPLVSSSKLNGVSSVQLRRSAPSLTDGQTAFLMFLSEEAA